MRQLYLTQYIVVVRRKLSKKRFRTLKTITHGNTIISQPIKKPSDPSRCSKSNTTQIEL